MKPPRHTTAGLTLVELLVAAVIAGLLLAVILAVYGSIWNTIAVQNRWRETALPAAEALDRIGRDLACAVLPFGITNQPFTAAFAVSPQTSLKLDFYSAFQTDPDSPSNDWRGYSISRVSYFWQAGGATGECMLTRVSAPFRAPSRNPLASGQEQWRGITEMEMAFFDGSCWTNQWEGGRTTNSLPQAARVTLVSGGNNSRKIGTEISINAARQMVPEK
ncbi:MAG: prepilin-type N-terminal cleavage/methylation domain-containing protein [Kiritimatiellae bacterium]|nr:prepilin-type N-terminal cleavage/methylation domain-containing protein [Kiritimatiellia bacterium]